jgi:hypothetical protein
MPGASAKSEVRGRRITQCSQVIDYSQTIACLVQFSTNRVRYALQ